MASMDVDSAADAAKTTVPVVVRHQGKKYEVDVDVSEPGAIFKYQVFSLTGVQPENQKILIKGKQVKDDTEMSSLGLKPAQAIMVLGQPGAAPVRFEAPKEKPRFVEDIDGNDAALHDNTPGGLTNLGNTCYLNASLQAMRSIPELQDSLVNRFQGDATNTSPTLARQLREVYSRMSASHASYVPQFFLNTLRTLNPRFAERSRTGQGYAQQDAEEAWTFIMDNLRRTLFVKDEAKALPPAKEGEAAAATSLATTVESVPEDGQSAGAGASASSSVSTVKRYLAGEVEKTLVCDDPAGRTEAESAPTTETFLTLPCHISISINHLRDGLLAGLTEKIEKHSELLGRDATYTSTMKIARLPKYLTVHFVRFYWKRDIQKKAKIMRKVTFPHELDVSEMCTDALRAKLVPVREKVRDVRKELEEIDRTNKKRKRRLSMEKKAEAAAARFGAAPGASSSSSDDKNKDKKNDKKNDKDDKKEGAEGEAEDVEYKTDAQIDGEKRASLEKAKEELYQLVRPRLEEDRYANHTGLYELRAVVTHQGAGADSGHYTAFVKKGSIVNPKTGHKSEEDGNWWWFNDDNVTEVGSERIDQLAGGGESHSALILLYGSVPLPLPESRVTEQFFTS
ncbi:ubiquitin carboxyl-terminal hydrolase 14 [Sporothrix brasiliensis 5110]|uniref:Ubiquitin carboxyl-terminal hydrolase n=1 Tax=Sporothrix brasiliensis 5110 TaxID=1398154 RepID=A0A0C2EN00_9PEZI|nr:ubiquitin carboxyl-terminal hydrolase 14 [Sporothrix brasiliensis 5110]KIH87499.1 ubiquitin carboxyl-terminal hydrolase 14 [Sporothrix brasiliensis 5110]